MQLQNSTEIQIYCNARDDGRLGYGSNAAAYEGRWRTVYEEGYAAGVRAWRKKHALKALADFEAACTPSSRRMAS